MPIPILSAQRLVKRYGKVEAVAGVSFDVAEGSCLGLLGPNGAGKSTTIEMLEGVAKPTSGTVAFRGESIHAVGDRRYRERLGIQFQSTALQDFLTVRENLRFFAALYGKSRSLDELIAVCRLEEFLDRDTRKLSGGQRQRVLLAIALVNDPEVVFLDEPTTGLDPQARRNFWELVRTIKQEGKTLLLTTHYMEEAYELCDEIAIMDQGRIIAKGTPKGLLAEHYSDAVLELPSELVADSPIVFRNRGDLSELATTDVPASFRALDAAGIPLGALRIRQRTLEDLFLDLTGRELRG